jgi:uncharacterized protein (TIGR02466 family)
MACLSHKNGACKIAMPETLTLFSTYVHRAPLAARHSEDLRAELLEACEELQMQDAAGRKWCKQQNYKGYTSYASLADLPQRFPAFETLRRALDKHIAAFSDHVGFELGGGKLKLDSLWVNVMPAGGTHSGHIHPHSVVSGTFYLALPEGAAQLKLEDPRLGMMMAAPPRKADSAQNLQSFVFLTPQEGEVILWESWLRHEVVMNRSKTPRVSISFNYAWV